MHARPLLPPPDSHTFVAPDAQHCAPPAPSSSVYQATKGPVSDSQFRGRGYMHLSMQRVPIEVVSRASVEHVHYRQRASNITVITVHQSAFGYRDRGRGDRSRRGVLDVLAGVVANTTRGAFPASCLCTRAHGSRSRGGCTDARYRLHDAARLVELAEPRCFACAC